MKKLNNKGELIALSVLNGDAPSLVAENFGLSVETVTRYVRKYKQSFRDQEVDTKSTTDNQARVLFLDIETSFMLVRTFETGKVYIDPDNVVADWFIICWSAKWHGSKETISYKVTETEALERDDRRICYAMWQHLNDADIIVAQNGKEFDIKKLNSKFIEYDFGRPSPYLVVDTLEQLRKNAKFSSNRLNYVSQKLFNNRKDKTDKSLWVRCEHGDADAISYMSKYCAKDVLLLEKLYMKIRAWVNNHPNIAMISGEKDVCPVCLSPAIKWDCGTFRTNVSEFVVGRCSKCKSLVRQKKRNNNAELLTLSR